MPNQASLPFVCCIGYDKRSIGMVSDRTSRERTGRSFMADPDEPMNNMMLRKLLPACTGGGRPACML